MVDTRKLAGLIAENGLSQRKLAKKLGMADKTFYLKMKKGVFDSDEMWTMIEILCIKSPETIFFAKQVT